jgi:hypothetical protein
MIQRVWPIALAIIIGAFIVEDGLRAAGHEIALEIHLRSR